MLAGELDNILVKEKYKREQRYTHKEDDDELKGKSVDLEGFNVLVGCILLMVKTKIF